jgi:hypothetical protein
MLLWIFEFSRMTWISFLPAETRSSLSGSLMNRAPCFRSPAPPDQPIVGGVHRAGDVSLGVLSRREHSALSNAGH